MGDGDGVWYCMDADCLEGGAITGDETPFVGTAGIDNLLEEIESIPG